MCFDTLLVERDGAVAIVTFNRPKVLNALNSQTLTELETVLDELQQDAGVRAIVLTGAGEKAFVAGADINELAVLSPVEGQRARATGSGCLRCDRAPRQAGHCRGQRLCARRRLRAGDGVHAPHRRRHAPGSGSPKINLGIIPGYAGSQRLPRLVGKGMRSGDSPVRRHDLAPQRAYEIGLVNRVVPAADLLPKRRSSPHALAAKAPIAVRYILEAVQSRAARCRLPHGAVPRGLALRARRFDRRHARGDAGVSRKAPAKPGRE